MFTILEVNQRLERENKTLKQDLEQLNSNDSQMITPRNKREKYAAEH